MIKLCVVIIRTQLSIKKESLYKEFHHLNEKLKIENLVRILTHLHSSTSEFTTIHGGESVLNHCIWL